MYFCIQKPTKTLSMQKVKVLYISQEILPYNKVETQIAKVTRELPQHVNETHEKDVRLFMPKYGSINERRYQLHEVIRLSGMNMVIDDVDYPLIIKVASVPDAKMQVYFMDNEELFTRKSVFGDESTPFFADNHTRMVFFCRSVLETINKLGWVPDIIHCNGWMTSLIPAYIKKNYAEESVFKNAKIVFSTYNALEGELDTSLSKISEYGNVSSEMLSEISEPNWENLTKYAAKYSDGVVLSCNNNVMEDYLNKNNIPFVKETTGEDFDKINTFYDSVYVPLTVEV